MPRLNRVQNQHINLAQNSENSRNIKGRGGIDHAQPGPPRRLCKFTLPIGLILDQGDVTRRGTPQNPGEICIHNQIGGRNDQDLILARRIERDNRVARRPGNLTQVGNIRPIIAQPVPHPQPIGPNSANMKNRAPRAHSRDRHIGTLPAQTALKSQRGQRFTRAR